MSPGDPSLESQDLCRCGITLAEAWRLVKPKQRFVLGMIIDETVTASWQWFSFIEGVVFRVFVVLRLNHDYQLTIGWVSDKIYTPYTSTPLRSVTHQPLVASPPLD